MHRRTFIAYLPAAALIPNLARAQGSKARVVVATRSGQGGASAPQDSGKVEPPFWERDGIGSFALMSDLAIGRLAQASPLAPPHMA